MSGIDKILQKLEEENRLQCEDILRRAEAQAKSVDEQIDAETDAACLQIAREARGKADRIRAIADNGAEAIRRRNALGAKVAMIDRVLSDALRAMESLPADRFYEAAKGLEAEPERGARCEKCFRLRLSETARAAKEAGADYFATTLSISPLKDAQLLNQIGEELSESTGVPWLPSDFKKKNGFLRSTELSKEYGMYRQDYCGCVFSKREREQQKKEKQ